MESGVCFAFSKCVNLDVSLCLLPSCNIGVVLVNLLQKVTMRLNELGIHKLIKTVPGTK